MVPGTIFKTVFCIAAVLEKMVPGTIFNLCFKKGDRR